MDSFQISRIWPYTKQPRREKPLRKLKWMRDSLRQQSWISRQGPFSSSGLSWTAELWRAGPDLGIAPYAKCSGKTRRPLPMTIKSKMVHTSKAVWESFLSPVPSYAVLSFWEFYSDLPLADIQTLRSTCSSTALALGYLSLITQEWKESQTRLKSEFKSKSPENSILFWIE